MHAMKCAFKIFLECVEGDVERVLAGDENIVLSRPRGRCGDRGDSSLQAAPDAIALDGPAYGLGHGEAEAGG